MRECTIKDLSTRGIALRSLVLPLARMVPLTHSHLLLHSTHISLPDVQGVFIRA
jgi:hypothetical protein